MHKGQWQKDKPAFVAPRNNAAHKGKSTAFSFGDPEGVLTRNISDYAGLFVNPYGDYYQPPIDQDGLMKLTHANGHHGTIPYFKANMLTKWLTPSDTVSREDMGNASYDLDVFGHCYFKIITNRLGQHYWLKHKPALRMRALKQADRFCELVPSKEPINYAPGEILQIKKYDPSQPIYGKPEYYGGLHSVLLNEDATQFRRKYYLNGAHMGYIFYAADLDIDEAEETKLKKQIQSSKGVGNFRSMYLNVADGKKDSIQIIPVGDIATKDEFEKVKNITRNDILAAWRMNGALAGTLPENTGGFGDWDKITRNNFENEVYPVQQKFLQVNAVLPSDRQIHFGAPAADETTPTAPPTS